MNFCQSIIDAGDIQTPSLTKIRCSFYIQDDHVHMLRCFSRARQRKDIDPFHKKQKYIEKIGQLI